MHRCPLGSLRDHSVASWAGRASCRQWICPFQAVDMERAWVPKRVPLLLSLSPLEMYRQFLVWSPCLNPQCAYWGLISGVCGRAGNQTRL